MARQVPITFEVETDRKPRQDKGLTAGPTAGNAIDGLHGCMKALLARHQCRIRVSRAPNAPWYRFVGVGLQLLYWESPAFELANRPKSSIPGNECCRNCSSHLNCGSALSFLWPFENIPTDLSFRHDLQCRRVSHRFSFNRHQSAGFVCHSAIPTALAAAMHWMRREVFRQIRVPCGTGRRADRRNHDCHWLAMAAVFRLGAHDVCRGFHLCGVCRGLSVRRLGSASAHEDVCESRMAAILRSTSQTPQARHTAVE